MTIKCFSSQILNSFINAIDDTTVQDSTTKFELSNNDKISSIITNVAETKDITILPAVKTNISTYTSTVNTDIDSIDSDQSITKILTQTTKVAVASTELLTNTTDKPDFENTIDMTDIQATIATNASKVIVTNVDIIGGTFKFKIAVSSYWPNKNLPLYNSNGSFTKLLTTVSSVDSADNRVTVSLEFEFKPRGKDFDGFVNTYKRDTSFEIVQWGKIPISKAIRTDGDGWGQQFYLFYGTITATDVPTIQLGTNFRSAFYQSIR